MNDRYRIIGMLSMTIAALLFSSCGTETCRISSRIDCLVDGKNWNARPTTCKRVGSSNDKLLIIAFERRRKRYDAPDYVRFRGIPISTGRTYLRSEEPKAEFFVHEEKDAAVDRYIVTNDSTSWFEITKISPNGAIEANFHLQLHARRGEPWNIKYPERILITDGFVRVHMR